MTEKPATLCIGRVYCDLIFTDLPRMPTMGTEVYAGGFGVHAGGGAFITAAYLASLGHRSALSAMLPPPPFGDILSEDLEHSGIDLHLCRRMSAGEEPQVTVALVGEEDRAFVTRRSGPAFPSLEVSALTGIGVAHVHIGEMATLVERPDIIDVARRAGATVSLDCSWDDTLSISDIARDISQVDVFLPNETEMSHLLEIGLPQSKFPLTVIKQGPRGATALVEGKPIHAPAQAVPVVDTTGAGDAFNAGFLSAWIAKETLSACLAAGNKQGAKAISGRGGFHEKTVQEV